MGSGGRLQAVGGARLPRLPRWAARAGDMGAARGRNFAFSLRRMSVCLTLEVAWRGN
jgi:hypothetical protein